MEFGRRYTVTCIVVDVPSPRKPHEYPHIGYIMFLETTIIGLYFAADNIGLASLKFFWWAQKFCLFLQGHPRSLILRLPISPSYSNLGPILHRFGDFARFCAPDPTRIPP